MPTWILCKQVPSLDTNDSIPEKKPRNLQECIQAHHPTALTSQSPGTPVHPRQPIKKKIALPSGVVVKNDRIGMSMSTPSGWKGCFILMYLEKINGG